MTVPIRLAAKVDRRTDNERKEKGRLGLGEESYSEGKEKRKLFRGR